MTEIGDEFATIFADEADERLTRVVKVLLDVERGRSPEDCVEVIFRDVHALKGTASMVGRDDVSRLAHGLEDVLSGLRPARVIPPELVGPLLRAADALRQCVENPDLDEAPPPAEVREPTRPAATGGAAGPAVAHESGSADERPNSIRVPADKLSGLLHLAGEALLNQTQLEHLLDAQASTNDGIADQLALGRRIVEDFKTAALGFRMLPFSSITASFPRAVRDMAVAAGKDAELVITGADTELDRLTLEALAEPITHLLRNAIAHGIESPETRRRAGKPAHGVVELRAEQRGATVSVSVSDDGVGVPAQALIGGEQGLVETLTQPGFSTAESVSAVSGRGVGLSAVRKRVEACGGTVRISTRPGGGTTVELLLPLALGLLEVLLVERSGQVYGFPLDSVVEVVLVDAPPTVGGYPTVELRGRPAPLVDLADALECAADPLAAKTPAVVVRADGRVGVIACDRLLGGQEVVVERIAPFVTGIPGYLGAAVLSDGGAALLIDPDWLTRPRVIPTAPADEGAPVLRRVLVVEDSFTIRELQRSILAAAGYEVETAKDGREALDRVSTEPKIDIVVTDVDMPHLDGIGLAKAIRATPALSALPIVIVTALGDDEQRRRGLEAGADAYIVKSGFDQRALVDTLESLVGR